MLGTHPKISPIFVQIKQMPATRKILNVLLAELAPCTPYNDQNTLTSFWTNSKSCNNSERVLLIFQEQYVLKAKGNRGKPFD